MIMAWAGALLMVAGFVVIFVALRLVQRARMVNQIAQAAMQLVGNKDIDEEEKEKQMQAYAVRLFGLFLILTVGGAAAVFAPLGVVWLLEQVGLMSMDDVLAVVMSPAFLIGTTIAAILIIVLFRRASTSHGDSQYSFVDRMVHRIAFKSGPAQVSLADMEDRKHKDALATINHDNPVFITALPRAGTTMLLEFLADLDDFASHRYRDMPFVMIPTMWAAMSKKHQQGEEQRERAHGDGMMVNADSPEALEEVLWKFFFKKHYKQDRIVPWNAAIKQEFHEFFTAHMKKIILIRKGNDQAAAKARYISKNNANITRIDLLQAMYPNSTVMIPFRDPEQHVMSLMRQHTNFVKMQDDDPFVLTYMSGIGHYDFGKALKPIDFHGWLDKAATRDATTANFWLAYWITAYRHLLTKVGDRVHLVSYEQLCASPGETLQRMIDALNVQDTQPLLDRVATIHAVKMRELDATNVDRSLLDEAKSLHEELINASLHGPRRNGSVSSL